MRLLCWCVSTYSEMCSCCHFLPFFVVSGKISKFLDFFWCQKIESRERENHIYDVIDIGHESIVGFVCFFYYHEKNNNINKTTQSKTDSGTYQRLALRMSPPRVSCRHEFARDEGIEVRCL